MVVSEPLSVIPGHGKQAKFVKDCTEICLGGRGIQHLAGFERLVNLEVLWLNDNKLRCLAGLDHNIRIKQLYAHNNSLCTVKGTLTKLKFLTHLDLSHNQLRGLHKVLDSLQKLKFLEELNLQGNPCCEEPQYRQLVLSALPSLKVFDHREVTTLERLQAAGLTSSGHVKAPTSHIPNAAQEEASLPQGTSITAAAAAAAAASIRRWSVLEQELAEEAATIRQQQQEAAHAAEQALYTSNPHAAYFLPHSSLPPNPALLQAQQTWAAASSSASSLEPQLCPSHTSNLQQTVSGRSECAATVLAGLAGPGGSSSGDACSLAARGCLQGTFSYRPAAAVLTLRSTQMVA